MGWAAYQQVPALPCVPLYDVLPYWTTQTYVAFVRCWGQEAPCHCCFSPGACTSLAGKVVVGMRARLEEEQEEVAERAYIIDAKDTVAGCDSCSCCRIERHAEVGVPQEEGPPM